MNDYIETIRRKIGHDLVMICGAAVFVHKGGKILLQRRRDDGTWADHGGCIEIGETPEQAARREMFEETGLAAGKLELLGVYSGPDYLHTYPNGDQAYLVVAYYLCEEFTGTPIRNTEETTDLRWFPIHSLPEPLARGVLKPLQDCLKLLAAR
jgi:8-oxo-dGTP pyrophosphatase MutT (NUDIX family)